MKHVAKYLTELIGNTPLLELTIGKPGTASRPGSWLNWST